MWFFVENEAKKWMALYPGSTKQQFSIPMIFQQNPRLDLQKKPLIIHNLFDLAEKTILLYTFFQVHYYCFTSRILSPIVP